MAIKYISKKDENKITTLQIERKQRYKLGMLKNGNEKLREALDRILNDELKRITISKIN